MKQATFYNEVNSFLCVFT